MSDKRDIVNRLRDQRDEDGYCVVCGDGKWKSHFPKCTLCDAADEIERLRARLRYHQNGDGPEALTDDCITQNERRLLADNERLRSLITAWSDEIERLRNECHKLAGYLMSELVFVHERLIEEIDVALEPYLGG